MFSLKKHNESIIKYIILKTKRYKVKTSSDYLKLEKCYKLLDVKEDCKQSDIKEAYIKLVKRFHPDSGSNEANADKFNEIEKAYRFLRTNCAHSNENTIVEEEDFRIKHTAPQHRQYLSYDGVGSGTPFDRQKQYIKFRASQASENILKHRLNKKIVLPEDKSLIDKSQTKYKHKINTRYGFDRLVEDLIQEAISKGEFKNLSGVGKPLPTHQNSNPYVDFVTHKINQILIDNGFTPEWIMLQKEIREEIELLKTSLSNERLNIGTTPITSEENEMWSKILNKHEKLVKSINIKINKYNLLVPILQKQMALIKLDSLAKKILMEGKTKYNIGCKKTQQDLKNEVENQDFFSFVRSFFN